MNGKEQRIAKLNAVQQQRKQDCIDRTEKAIAKLLQNNKRISFGAIARIANVSISYLYKYPEIKERIQDIRDQQVKNARKLTRPQIASEKSKQVIIKQLRECINTIEWEKKELKKQNAISAVEDYLNTDKKVKSKAGLLRTALEEGWTPNLTNEERQLTQVTDTFSEWFKLAKDQGIVQASQGTKDGILVMDSTGEWTPLTTMIEKGWTLEYLQKRNKG